MELLNKLISYCKYGILISINEHRDVYMSIEQYIEHEEIEKEDFEKEILEQMIKQDRIIKLQVYPDTPNNGYIMHHYDIKTLISEMIDFIVKNRREYNKKEIKYDKLMNSLKKLKLDRNKKVQ